MTRWLYALGRRCALHGRLVIGIWLIAAFVLLGANQLLPSSNISTFSLSGTDSTTAQTLLNQAFPQTNTDPNPVVLSSPTLNFGEGEGKATVDRVASELRQIPAVSSVQTPSDIPSQLSKDGHTATVGVTINGQQLGEESVSEDVLNTAKEAAGPGVEVDLGGYLGQQLSRPDTHQSERLGLLAALIVLFFTLRRVWAMVLPLINAIFAVGIGLAIVGLVGRVVFIPDVAPTLGTMLGLGVGIDYALFLVTRHRKLLRQGYEVPDAIGRTLGTAGAGMVFAGGTLIAAVCGLTLTGISFLAWLGYAAGVVVLIAVAASLTLVPAILGVMGQRVLPKKPRPEDDPSHEELDKTVWAKLANAVTNKPWPFAIISTVILLVLAAPTLTLSLGQTDASNLPPETISRQAYDAMAAGFGPGSTAPLVVTSQMYTVATAPPGVTGPGDPRTQDPRLQNLRNVLAATPGVVQANQPIVSTDGGVAIIKITPEWNAADPQTAELVERLRTQVIPPATEGQGMASYVGGITALSSDLNELIAQRTPLFIFGVVLLSFILLMLAYRSLLIPFKAAIMNLLSIAAAYGVVTVIFQWGWGAEAIGLSGPVPIDSYIPMMMFAVLFGLSMDYEVFLLTAFREHWSITGDMKIAVRRGLADSGRLVTAAAMIMVVVFASFILSDNATVKMFGVGLATAVAVDATIVRCLLVPAIMVLAAKGTWWLPGWLDRLLPQLHVEGDPNALEDIASDDKTRDFGRRPVVLHRPILVVGTALGVVIAWALVTRLPALPFDARTSIAMSAVLGGVTVLLPPGFGGGSGSRPFRAFGYFLGVILGLIVVGILSIVVPPVPADNGAVTAWAIVIVALLAVLVVGRSLALPLLLGAIATAISLALLAAYEPNSATLIIVTLLPAFITMMVASIVVGLWRAPKENPDESGDPVVPLDSSPSNIGGGANPNPPEDLVPMLQSPGRSDDSQVQP